MSFYENFSELARELRTAAGTVLSIVGSRLEADARAQAEYGPQWLTEFEAERDVVESEQLFECVQTDCGCHADDRYAPFPDMCVCGHSDVDHYRAGGLIDPCNKCDCLDLLFKASAADTAADPSPATTTGCSRAGDEGPEGASAIPPAAPSGQPTSEPLCDVMDFRETHLPLRCTLDADHSGDHVAHGWGGQTWATWPQSMRADPESDPGVVTSPAPGERGVWCGKCEQCDPALYPVAKYGYTTAFSNEDLASRQVEQLVRDLAQAVLHLSQVGPPSDEEFKYKYNPLLGRAFAAVGTGVIGVELTANRIAVVELPEPCAKDDDGQVFFGDWDIRADCSGSLAYRMITTDFGLGSEVKQSMPPARAEWWARHLLAAAAEVAK